MRCTKKARDDAGLEPFVEFEMLEGMANHQARAVRARAGGLLLYAPVVRAEVPISGRSASTLGMKRRVKMSAATSPLTRTGPW